MKKSIYLVLLLIGCIFASCMTNEVEMEILASRKIVMEVGDSLLLHWETNRIVWTKTTSVDRANFDKGWEDDPKSAICYVKDAIENGNRVLDGDVYLYAQQTGRDTLVVEIKQKYYERGNISYYPILVVDK